MCIEISLHDNVHNENSIFIVYIFLKKGLLKMADLPKLTDKQQQFVLRYAINGNNGAEAYRFAYDCEGSSEATINVEVNKLLKNPKVSLWIQQAENNVQQVFKDEIKYSALDCFNELDEVRLRAKNSLKSEYSNELKAIELKGKLAGHFIDKHQVTGGGLADVLDKLK